MEVSIDSLRERTAMLIEQNQNYFGTYYSKMDLGLLTKDIRSDNNWNNDGGDLAAQIIATIIGQNVNVITPYRLETRKPLTGFNLENITLSASQSITIAYNGRDHYMATTPAKS